jgi:hypothetical protein
MTLCNSDNLYEILMSMSIFDGGLSQYVDINGVTIARVGCDLWSVQDPSSLNFLTGTNLRDTISCIQDNYYAKTLTPQHAGGQHAESSDMSMHRL